MSILKINKGDGTSFTVGTYGLTSVSIDSPTKINLRYNRSASVTLNVEITYTNTNQTSPMQMRTFFNNALIDLANSNNSAPVWEVTSPLPITAVAVTG